MGETLKFRPLNCSEMLLLCPFGSMKVCATHCGSSAESPLVPAVFFLLVAKGFMEKQEMDSRIPS